MIVLCLAFCFSGFGSLCLGVDRHHEQVFGHKPVPLRRQLLRLLGWLLLTSAAAPAIFALGTSIGLALWTSVLGLAAFAQITLLSYRPSLVPALSIGALPFALFLHLI
ncbi:DUF3325 domain-containing protein [Pseudomonas sp. KB-10]|uniref:DUF3325 domain-containing protein n=1 Tax=Pseudomonas sp. KB-10 TaxID=2292264 RepID=UPI001BAE9648|nr:DUF3325 domain-containing protein [Pseudomonas sp. KB-10]